MTTSEFILLLALMNVALFILAAKWGALTFYQLNRLKWMPEACNFCLFFWMAFAEQVFIEAVHNHAHSYDCAVTVIVYSLIASVLSLFFKPK